MLMETNYTFSLFSITIILTFFSIPTSAYVNFIFMHEKYIS